MDPARLARAVHLTSAATGPGRHIVTGGAEPHVVSESADGALACDCADAAMRSGVECKHMLRVRLARGDAEVVEALGTVVPMPRRCRRARRAS